MSEPSPEIVAQVRRALATLRDNHPEGNADSGAWDIRGAPSWQAAIIRLARPMLLWMLGVVVMGFGVVIVGTVEAVFPGAGLRMATAMAALLRAYPTELYILLATVFLGQATSSAIGAINGRKRP
ncbi:hypothetical protein BH10PSE12_BH10PSE12_02560 [soil metagenome]